MKKLLVLISLIWLNQTANSQIQNNFDFVIYGGTSAGISAAIQASRLGKSVILIEPTGRIGGLTTGGLGQTDIGNKQAIGGIAREFYQNIKKYYQQPENWKWQKSSEYKDGGQTRRMVSYYVMTQYHCEGLTVAPDPVGLAAYGMDSHHVQRYVTSDGYVKNEGNVETPVKGPYSISYRSMVPKKKECKNLLVPVCLSATHIAFGSIRMEPVFMVLGQSAALAASIAIDQGIPIQDLPYEELRPELEKAQQRLK
jgi:hypothetical protein